MTSAPSSSAEDGPRPPLPRRLFLHLLATLIGAVACNVPGLRHLTPAPPDATAPPPPPATGTPTPVPDPSPPAPAASATPAPVPVAMPRLIVDGHEDLAWNWLEFGRDPAQDALAGRASEAGSDVQWAAGARTVGLPQWLQGQVAVVFATLFVMPERHSYGGWMTQTYANTEQAASKAGEQLSRYRELDAREPQVRLIETIYDLEQVLATWWTPDAEPAVGLVILMEGADPIQSPAQVREWYERGVRIVGPAWVQTRYAGGTGEPGPLTGLGRELLAEMAQVGMILDLSHLAEAAYLEAVESYAGAVIASHANPRAFLPTDRGLSDEMIRRLAARGGVVGIMPYNRYLLPGWEVGQGRAAVPITRVAEAVDAVVQLTGSIEHVALGSDFDGGFGVEAIPAGMDTVADLGLIGEALAARGYADQDVALVLGGNWLRILRSHLPTA